MQLSEFPKNNFLKFLGVLTVILSIGLAGCSSNKEVVTVYKEVQKTPLELPEYPEIKFKDVKFEVINVDDKIYYGLDVENYTHLSKNMSEVTSYIKYLKTSLNKYRDYYEGNSNDKDRKDRK